MRSVNVRVERRVDGGKVQVYLQNPSRDVNADETRNGGKSIEHAEHGSGVIWSKVSWVDGDASWREWAWVLNGAN